MIKDHIKKIAFANESIRKAYFALTKGKFEDKRLAGFINRALSDLATLSAAYAYLASYGQRNTYESTPWTTYESMTCLTAGGSSIRFTATKSR